MINPVKIAAGYLFGVAAFVALDWTALTFLPLSTWVEYRTVRIVPPVPLGGPIDAQSDLVRHRISDMRFSDTLFCDLGDGNGYRLYSTIPSSFESAPPKDGISNWTYTGPVPSIHAWCYMRSTINIDLKYGIEKKPQIIISEPFEIGSRP